MRVGGASERLVCSGGCGWGPGSVARGLGLAGVLAAGFPGGFGVGRGCFRGLGWGVRRGLRGGFPRRGTGTGSSGCGAHGRSPGRRGGLTGGSPAGSGRVERRLRRVAGGARGTAALRLGRVVAFRAEPGRGARRAGARRRAWSAAGVQRGRAVRASPSRPRTAHPGNAAPSPLAQRDGRHGRRDGCRERAPPGPLSPEAQRAAWSPTRARTAQRGARSRGGRRNAEPEGGPGGSPMRGRGARPADPGARVGGDGAARPSTGPLGAGAGRGRKPPPSRAWRDPTRGGSRRTVALRIPSPCSLSARRAEWACRFNLRGSPYREALRAGPARGSGRNRNPLLFEARGADGAAGPAGLLRM